MGLIKNILIAGAMLVPSLACALTLTVTTSSDVGTGSCISATSCTSLRAAIDQAASGDIIEIPSGVIYLSSTLLISKDLTLNGVGSTLVAIDGGNSQRVMEFSASSLNINNLQIQNGASNDGSGGGGLLIQNGNVTITGATFTGNSALTAGGAINNNGVLTIQRSTIFDNQAASGAAITVGGTSEASVYYSTIVANASTTNATVAAIDNTGTFTAEGSLFHNPLDCAGTGSIVSLGYNLEATNSCNFQTGNLTPDYANVAQSPVASTLSGSARTQILEPDPTFTSIIDIGPSTCTGQDQVGTTVPQNQRCDIGAIEVVVSTPTPSTTPQNGYDDDDEYEDHDDDDDDHDDDDSDDGIGMFGGFEFLCFLGLFGWRRLGNRARTLRNV